MNDILTHEPILVNTGPGAFIVADPPTFLEEILAEANQQGLYYRGGIVQNRDGKDIAGPDGTLYKRATRGYLIFEVRVDGVPGGMPSLTLLMWDSFGQPPQWTIRTTEERVNAWLAEAEAAMGLVDEDESAAIPRAGKPVAADIPFDGRRAAPRRAVVAADEYGLEARG